MMPTVKGSFRSLKGIILKDRPCSKKMQTCTDDSNLLRFTLVRAQGLAVMDISGSSDPYCVIQGGTNYARTPVVDKCLDPVWNFVVEFNMTPNDRFLTIVVFDADKLSKDDCLGQVSIPVAHLPSEPNAAWYPLTRAATTQPAQGSLYLAFDGYPRNPDIAYVNGEFQAVMQKVHCSYDFLALNLATNLDCIYSTPGFSEEVEWLFENIVVSTNGLYFDARLYLTNFRLVILENDHFENKSDRSVAKPITLSVPFTIISSVKAKKNDRILPDATCTVLRLECTDFKIINCLINTNLYPDVAVESFSERLEFHKLYVIDNPPALQFPLAYEDMASTLKLDALSLPPFLPFNMCEEMKRQGVPLDVWRHCTINSDYSMCSSYPKDWFVPNVSDHVIKNVATFRSRGRIPVMTWYNSVLKNVLFRSAQPLSGLAGKINTDDEQLLQHIRDSTPSKEFLIFDARSKFAADGNKLGGKGTENVQRYTGCHLLFMDIGNIHKMRHSLDGLWNIVTSSNLSDDEWIMAALQTKWLKHTLKVLRASRTVALKLDRGISVLVHCSDGWDRTAQMSSLAQLLIDPYFRTVDGFINLIRKEWLGFGHKFAERLGRDPSKPNERSPIFFQFLDCVWQILQQEQNAFEFNEDFLCAIMDSANGAWFGTFLCNSDMAREQLSPHPCLWSHLLLHRELYINENYASVNRLLRPLCTQKAARFWSYILRYDQIWFGDDSQDEDLYGSGVKRRSKVAVIQPKDSRPVCTECRMKFNVLGGRKPHNCDGCGYLFCPSCLQKGKTQPKKHLCESCTKQAT